MTTTTTALPCPFCGHPADLNDPDTLYPSGTGWKLSGDPQRKSYHNFREVPREQWCYSFHCPKSSGGCGAEMSGDSMEEAVTKWNTRTVTSSLQPAVGVSPETRLAWLLDQLELRLPEAETKVSSAPPEITLLKALDAKILKGMQ